MSTSDSVLAVRELDGLLETDEKELGVWLPGVAVVGSADRFQPIVSCRARGGRILDPPMTDPVSG